MSTRELKCPSCDGPMQQVDKRGVLIDICRDCRGVFLDRGELDKLLEEGARQEQTALADEAERFRRRPRDDEEYDDRGGEGYGRRRKGGWLGDILDLD